jgi:hypothetical protein
LPLSLDHPGSITVDYAIFDTHPCFSGKKLQLMLRPQRSWSNLQFGLRLHIGTECCSVITDFRRFEGGDTTQTATVELVAPSTLLSKVLSNRREALLTSWAINLQTADTVLDPVEPAHFAHLTKIDFILVIHFAP